jgi:hypothetical protein
VTIKNHTCNGRTKNNITEVRLTFKPDIRKKGKSSVASFCHQTGEIKFYTPVIHSFIQTETFHLHVHVIIRMHDTTLGQDSSVSIAACYGLDNPVIESRWGRDFLRPSRPALIYNGYCISFQGVKQLGHGD